MREMAELKRTEMQLYLLNHLPAFQESQYNFWLGSFVSAAVRQNRTTHAKNDLNVR
jgi:hypothetical protein